MDMASLLLELFDRIPPLAHDAVADLSPDLLTTPPAPGANTIAWLVWHMARVQDHHVADILGREQVWMEGIWPDEFGLPPDPSNTGYGHSYEQVLALRPKRPEALTGYLDAVCARTRPMLAALTGDELERIVDRRWDPPVTLGVRLISVAEDSLEHAGQAAYARGIITG